MCVVCVEVFKRYIMNACRPHGFFDLNNMLWTHPGVHAVRRLHAGTGSRTSQRRFSHSSMRPRMQASLDLVLYIVFFVPGIAALIYAGVDYAGDSWRINEHSNVTSDGPPVHQSRR
jgi:TRAP-type mannitol/chloroaromatic compound transport system permease small subunit